MNQVNGCWHFPSGASDVKELDMGSVRLKFTRGVSVHPGGSITVRFRDDGRVDSVCLEEPSALFGTIETLLPESEYTIEPPRVELVINTGG